MNIGLACIESKPNDLNFNLQQVINLMIVSQKHQVQLLLFGQRFLGEQPLSFDAQALFRLKIACTYYDLSIGIGYINDNNKDNYLVINNSGDVIYNHLSDDAFSINDFPFNCVLGDEGFNHSKVENILVWPILNTSSPKEWFNTELSNYRTQANQLSNESILINSFIEDKAFGGGFHLKDNQFLVNQPMGQKGLSILKI